MPDTRLSAAIKEAFAAAPASTVVLWTLEIRHTAFVAPIRVVRNHEAITATLEVGAPLNSGAAVVFEPLAFDIQLPDVSERGPGQFEITLDNVSRLIVQALQDAVAAGGIIEMTVRPYLSTDLSAPHWTPPVTMTVIEAEVDAFRVVVRAGVTRLANLAYPGDRYTLTRFPGLAA